MDPDANPNGVKYLEHICIQGKESWPETQVLADGTTYDCEEKTSGGKVGPKCRRQGASPGS